jgi:hypothetical protein
VPKIYHLRHPVFLAPVLVACATRPASVAPAGGELAVVESLYADLRAVRDRFDVSVAAGRTGINDATPMDALVLGHNTLRTDLVRRLAAIDSSALKPDDARALAVMRRTLARDLDSLVTPLATEAGTAERGTRG